VGTLSRRDLVLVLATPVLVVAVALVQLYRADALDQSSWSGAGFGMFATYESEITRFVRVYAVTESGETRLPVPPSAQRALVEARVVPTDGYLEVLADEVAAAVDDPEVESVRVELWAIDFDRDEARIDASMLNEVTVDVPAPAERAPG
jgi:hypothetical protein